jgi:hypothetical protein
MLMSGWARLCLWTAAISKSILPPDDIWILSPGRMILTGENWKTQKKHASVPLCPPEISHSLTPAWICASAVRDWLLADVYTSEVGTTLGPIGGFGWNFVGGDGFQYCLYYILFNPAVSTNPKLWTLKLLREAQLLTCLVDLDEIFVWK